MYEQRPYDYEFDSPRSGGSTPRGYYVASPMSSATPTPPRRPSTRAGHSRVNSYSDNYADSKRGFETLRSPRVFSDGRYATEIPLHVSSKHFTSSSSRRPSGSFQRPPTHGRSHSFAYVRSSTPYGESDEDEIIDITGGRTYVLPAQSRSKGRRHDHYSQDHDGVWSTNHHGYAQAEKTYHHKEQQSYESRHYPPPSRAPTSHSKRRPSMSGPPPRSHTARPVEPNPPHRSSRAPARAPPPARVPVKAKATDADAALHEIPAGYSLKNWDPAEEPILLLGSVFDANSLGKWIYDWTVARDGPKSAFSDMAGELWLLLIQLAGKIRRLEDVEGRVRSKDDRELVRDFLTSGERCTDKFLALIKKCETPMLADAKKNKSGLQPNAGIEFVNTLFGRDRELADTERIMQAIRTYSLRFDANCDELTREPTR